MQSTVPDASFRQWYRWWLQSPGREIVNAVSCSGLNDEVWLRYMYLVHVHIVLVENRRGCMDYE